MPSEIAHAALIDENNVVKHVIVIPYMDDDDEKINSYCHSIGLEGKWIDTSYHNKRRGVYAGEGHFYDAVADVFIPPDSPPEVVE